MHSIWCWGVVYGGLIKALLPKNSCPELQKIKVHEIIICGPENCKKKKIAEETKMFHRDDDGYFLWICHYKQFL